MILKARFNPNLRVLRQELQSNSYLVLAADKNLGIAVVSKVWYISECTNQLSNKSVYKQISDTDVIERANQVERWIETLLSSAAKITNSDEFNIFAQYLLTKVTTEAYGLGGRRLGRGPVTEKRGCAKEKVVTPLLAWHVQDEE